MMKKLTLVILFALFACSAFAECKDINCSCWKKECKDKRKELQIAHYKKLFNIGNEQIFCHYYFQGEGSSTKSIYKGLCGGLEHVGIISGDKGYIVRNAKKGLESKFSSVEMKEEFINTFFGEMQKVEFFTLPANK